MNKKNKILVSIIIPAYNSEQTINKTLDSLIEQTYKNYEVLVIDGLSSDRTIEIVKTYIPKFGDKLKWISEKDYGIYDAMNKGIKMAKGILIGILSSNDTFEKDAIENIADMYDPNVPDSIIYGMQRYIRDGKEVCVALYNHENLPEKMLAHPACFVAKSIYEKYGVFNTNYKFSADYEFLWRMFENCNITFVPVYKIISNFNTGGASGSQAGYLETVHLRFQKGQISHLKLFYIRTRCLISRWVYKLFIFNKRK